jgi:hypothetical protein
MLGPHNALRAIISLEKTDQCNPEYVHDDNRTVNEKFMGADLAKRSINARTNESIARGFHSCSTCRREICADLLRAHCCSQYKLSVRVTCVEIGTDKADLIYFITSFCLIIL